MPASAQVAPPIAEAPLAPIDVEARNARVLENLGLVGAVIKGRLRGRGGVDPDDAYQFGVMGLLRAAEKFEPGRGFRFSTYATSWIRHAIRRGLVDTGPTIRVPAKAQARARAFRRACRLAAGGGVGQGEAAEAVAAAVLARMGRTPERRRHIADAARAMDLEVVHDGPEGSLTARLPARPDGGGGEDRGEDDRLPAVRAALAGLPARMRLVLALRLGLDGDRVTLAEVGRHLGVTQERARQVEKQALGRLRAQLGASDADECSGRPRPRPRRAMPTPRSSRA